MGEALVVSGALLWTGTTFGLRTRAPKALVAVLLAASGVMIGVGGLAMQEGVTALEWVITPVFLAGAAGFQARMMLGPFGKPTPSSGTVSPRREK